MTTPRELLKASTPGRWRYQKETEGGFGYPFVTKYRVYKDGGTFGHPATCDHEEDAALICALRNCAEELLTLWEAAQEYADCEFGMQPQGGGKERWEHRKSKLEAFKAALSRLREKGEV